MDCKCKTWVRDGHTEWQMKQTHHKDCPDAGRTPRLFYYEEAVDGWCPVPEKVENIVSPDCLEVGDTQTVEFKMIGMNHEEFDNLPVQ